MSIDTGLPGSAGRSIGRRSAVPSSAFKTAATLFFALTHLACLRDPIRDLDDSPTVDAGIYALGFCSHKCYRLDQCDLTGGIPKQTCERSCVDEALQIFPSDPCWAEQIEVRRCIVRETTCDGVEDEELPSGSETVCDHRQQELDACER